MIVSATVLPICVNHVQIQIYSIKLLVMHKVVQSALLILIVPNAHQTLMYVLSVQPISNKLP
jgi:hypothetical protein